MKKSLTIIIVLVIAFAAWKLGSPLFIDKEVNEELPFELVEEAMESMEMQKVAEEKMEMEMKAMMEEKGLSFPTEEEAMRHLIDARDRVETANDAWDAAAQPGDDEG